MTNDLISREALQYIYSKECHGECQFCNHARYTGADGKHEYGCALINDAPAVDAAPVVRCKECVYWMDRHVLLNDGTRRPFNPGEDDVTCDVGINCGARCMFDADYMDGNGPFRQKEDFCSRGVKKDEGVENDG